MVREMTQGCSEDWLTMLEWDGKGRPGRLELHTIAEGKTVRGAGQMGGEPGGGGKAVVHDKH